MCEKENSFWAARTAAEADSATGSAFATSTRSTPGTWTQKGQDQMVFQGRGGLTILRQIEAQGSKFSRLQALPRAPEQRLMVLDALFTAVCAQLAQTLTFWTQTASLASKLPPPPGATEEKKE